jgi:hypothetical protein
MDEPKRALLRQAMQAAWRDWHGDVDEEIVPEVSFAFEKGFWAAVAFLLPDAEVGG